MLRGGGLPAAPGHRCASRERIQPVRRSPRTILRAGWFENLRRTRDADDGGDGGPPIVHNLRAHKEVAALILKQEIQRQETVLLNMEMYEEAREVARQAEELQEMTSADQSGVAGDDPNAVSDADAVVRLLQLRTDLTRAVDGEVYQEAARVRDEIVALEKQLEAQSAARDAGGLSPTSDPKYRLGQCVVHWKSGWTGVICGVDSVCKDEDPKWLEGMRKGPADGEGPWASQAFYHVLPDLRFWARSEAAIKQLAGTGALVAYYPEDELSAPEAPETWRSQHGDEGISHPYIYYLFYGKDGAGDYVPSRVLRDKWRVERRDVYWNNEEPGEGEDGDDGDDQGRGSGGAGGGPLN